jgi:5'-3' exoribonuclease 2
MPLQGLMTDDDSPIIDFYPDDFEIDMNGKKMVWQGVALLPFIDEKRLLKALKSKEPELSDDEKRRNKWGDNVMFIADHNALYDPFCALYTLKPVTKVCLPAPRSSRSISDTDIQPVVIDTQLSLGTSGSVLADPNCVPYSGLESPVPTIEECPDIPTNNSLSVRYYFPRQAHPHHSIILPGYKPIPAQLSEGDKDWVRRGGGPGGGGRGGRGGGGGFRGGPGMGNHPPRPPRNGGGGDYGSYGSRSGPPPPAPYGSYAPPPQAAYGGAGGYGNSGLPPNPYARGGPPPPPNPYAGNAYGAPSAAYGGYAPPPPPTLPRNGNGAYGAPPPNPYPPPRNGNGGGYGGGGGGYGGYGGNGGGYGGGGGGRR